MAKKLYEESKIQAIADRIRKWIGGTTKYTTAQMPSGVDEVYNRGVVEGLAITNGADATAADILKDKTAYVGGQMVTGEIETVHGSLSARVTPVLGDNIGPCVKMSYGTEDPIYLEPETSYIELCAPFSDFGDAELTDVASGKVFTSSAGFKATGTAPTYDEAYGDGYDEGYVDGVAITNDANATSDKILDGYSAWVAGEKVDGNIEIKDSVTIYETQIVGFDADYAISPNTAVPVIYLKSQFPGSVYCSANSALQLSTPVSEFGDAMAEDVAAGKTFTSTAGLKVVGTNTDTYDQGYIDGLLALTDNPITFTIKGTTYYAPSGTTWAKWVSSPYNMGGYRVQAGPNYVCSATGAIVTINGATVYRDNAIVSGGSYTHN